MTSTMGKMTWKVDKITHLPAGRLESLPKGLSQREKGPLIHFGVNLFHISSSLCQIQEYQDE